MFTKLSLVIHSRFKYIMYKKYEHRNAWLLTQKRWHIVRQLTLLHVEVQSSVGPSVLKDDIREWATSFSKLMRSEIGRQVFTQFLESEYSDENMLFWNACEDFKREQSSAKRQVMAKEIYNMFLSTSAPLEVNVDGKTRRELINKIDENPTKDTFLASQEHIYHLMERDCFRRFVQSPIYRDFLKRVEESGLPESQRSH